MTRVALLCLHPVTPVDKNPQLRDRGLMAPHNHFRAGCLWESNQQACSSLLGAIHQPPSRTHLPGPMGLTGTETVRPDAKSQ